MIVKLLDLYMDMQNIYITRQGCCKGVNKMIKIRISYTDEAEQKRFIGLITKGFKIVSLKAGKHNKNNKNMYLELQ